PHALVRSLCTLMEEAAIPSKHYRLLMDDISLGADSPAELRDLHAQLRPHLARRGFEENPQKLVSSLPERRSSSRALTHPCFGMLWSPSDDTLMVRPVRTSAEGIHTAMDLRRYSGVLFDPLGLLLEYNVQLRLLLRQIRQEIGPSGRLRPDHSQSLVKWEKSVNNRPLRVPRLLRSAHEPYSGLLFLFVDSSDMAGAAILTTAFGARIAGRGYLHEATGTRRSAPKLELDALASSVLWCAQHIAESLDHSPVSTLVICTDNSANVARLRRHPYGCHNCLHRLETARICTLVTHLSGLWNPADAASRGKVPSEKSDRLYAVLRDYTSEAPPQSLGSIPTLYRLPSDFEVQQPPQAACKVNKASPPCAPEDGADSRRIEVTEVPTVLIHTICSASVPADYDEAMVIPTTLYGYRLLASAFRSWQTLAVDLGDRDTDVDVAQDPHLLTALTLTVRDSQTHFGVDRLLLSPFSSIDSDGLVVRRCRHYVDGNLHSQIIVPQQHVLLQKIIVRSSHNLHHGGVGATYRDLVRRYHRSGLRRLVGSVVKACGICIKNKPRSHALQASGVYSSDRKPWSSIGIDHCGPYEGNGDRAKFLVVATCLLTGFVDAEVVGSTNAPNLITACRRIFSRNGFPRRVCSDRGSAYISSPFRVFLIKRNIQHHLVPAGSPQYGGKWERSHGPLNQKIRVLRATQNKLDWRTLVAEAVSLSNSRLRWGSLSSWDLLHTYGYDQSCSTSSRPANVQLRDAWEDDRERTRLRVGDKATSVAIGDTVYLSTPSPGKLGDLARGPYLVTHISGGVFSLKELATGKMISQPLLNLIPTKTGNQ
ncbi:hypothetical protein FOL47_000773, partial [Perkinsus chesapeaki]